MPGEPQGPGIASSTDLTATANWRLAGASWCITEVNPPLQVTWPPADGRREAQRGADGRSDGPAGSLPAVGRDQIGPSHAHGRRRRRRPGGPLTLRPLPASRLASRCVVPGVPLVSFFPPAVSRPSRPYESARAAWSATNADSGRSSRAPPSPAGGGLTMGQRRRGGAAAPTGSGPRGREPEISEALDPGRDVRSAVSGSVRPSPTFSLPERTLPGIFGGSATRRNNQNGYFRRISEPPGQAGGWRFVCGRGGPRVDNRRSGSAVG